MPRQGSPALKLELGNRREERAAREVGSSDGYIHELRGTPR